MDFGVGSSQQYTTPYYKNDSNTTTRNGCFFMPKRDEKGVFEWVPLWGFFGYQQKREKVQYPKVWVPVPIKKIQWVPTNPLITNYLYP